VAPDSALGLAKEAAGQRDVRVGGGVATLRAYLRARLIDEIHLAVVPALLGVGEALFDEIDLPSLGYTLTESAATKRATHVVLAKVR
jgi:dihydrofolate reductase